MPKPKHQTAASYSKEAAVSGGLDDSVILSHSGEAPWKANSLKIAWSQRFSLTTYLHTGWVSFLTYFAFCLVFLASNNNPNETLETMKALKENVMPINIRLCGRGSREGVMSLMGTA